jgi:hypothetical protein
MSRPRCRSCRNPARSFAITPFGQPQSLSTPAFHSLSRRWPPPSHGRIDGFTCQSAILLEKGILSNHEKWDVYRAEGMRAPTSRRRLSETYWRFFAQSIPFVPSCRLRQAQWVELRHGQFTIEPQFVQGTTFRLIWKMARACRHSRASLDRGIIIRHFRCLEGLVREHSSALILAA